MALCHNPKRAAVYPAIYIGREMKCLLYPPRVFPIKEKKRLSDWSLKGPLDRLFLEISFYIFILSIPERVLPVAIPQQSLIVFLTNHTMHLLATFGLLSVAMGAMSAQNVSDPQSNAPKGVIGEGKVTYILSDIGAKRGFDFLDPEPKCKAPNLGFRCKQNPNDATTSLQEGVAFFSSSGSDGSLADIYYQAAEIINLPSIPEFANEAQNQAFAQLIACGVNNLPAPIRYVNPAVIPTIAQLIISALIFSCFTTKRTFDSLRRFEVPTVRFHRVLPAGECGQT